MRLAPLSAGAAADDCLRWAIIVPVEGKVRRRTQSCSLFVMFMVFVFFGECRNCRGAARGCGEEGTTLVSHALIRRVLLCG